MAVLAHGCHAGRGGAGTMRVPRRTAAAAAAAASTRRARFCSSGRRRAAATILAAASKQSAAVGIDLGTTNSVVAVMRPGDARPAVLRTDGRGGAAAPGDAAGFVIPSVAAVDPATGEWLVGAAARAQAARNPLNTYYSVKRLLGRRAADVTAGSGSSGENNSSSSNTSGESSGASSSGSGMVYGLTADAGGGGVLLRCPALGRDLKPQEVSALVLRAALDLASAHLGEPVTEAVVTVPARFPAAARAATLEAAAAAGLARVALLQEPVAAAMAFGYGKPYEAETILVFDLGGGTYDVSLLDSFEGIVEVIATGGDAALGGDDYDRALCALLLERFCCGGGGGGGGEQAAAAAAAAAKALAAAPAAAAELLAAAEAAKVALSAAEQVAVRLPPAAAAALAAAGVEVPAAGEVTVTRADLARATAALRARLWPPLAGVAEECKVAFAADGPSFEAVLAGGNGSSNSSTASSSGTSSSSSSSPSSSAAAAPPPADKYAPKPRTATAAVLVGGATRMPAVRDYVRHVTGLAPAHGVDPEQCVAAGAAIHAGILMGLTGGVELMDGAYVEELQGRATGLESV